MIVVFDLDGTLCDIEHRLHHIQGEKKDWESFYRECVDDAPIGPILDVMANLVNSGENLVEIWTGRSIVVEKETIRWISRYGDFDFHNIQLKMRPEGDYRPDFKLKEQWLGEAIIKPHLVFEDRKQVVDMWRKNGILCCHVAEGEF